MHLHQHMGLILIIAFLIGAQVVTAHSPIIVNGNTNLETAHHMDNPTKSWVVYGDLPPGNLAAYFRFHMEKNQRIFSQVIIPVKDAQADFIPNFALLGPGFPREGILPSYIEMPEEVGILIVEGRRPLEATYEGFTPSSFYVMGELDLDAPETGEFYLVIYDDEESLGGHYGLVLGYRESFTIQEWILVPLNVIQIYLWEGNTVFFIALPFMIPLLAGLLVIGWRWRQRYQKNRIARYLASITGLLFLGTSCSLITQTMVSIFNTELSPQVAISLVLALLPLLLGVFFLQWALKNLEEFGLKQRVIFLLVASIGLLVWAGIIIGPLLAFIGSIIPPWRKQWISSL